MTHKFEQSDSGNDLLRARFTLWLNITLAHAKERYLDTHTEKFNIVPLDEFLANTIIYDRSNLLSCLLSML